MSFVQNFPFFSIVLAMFSGIVSSVLNAKAAKWLNTCVIVADTAMSLALLVWLIGFNGSYTYMMGHFPAPWGNEIRAGVLEALVASGFCIIMLLCMFGGRRHLMIDVETGKQNLYYIMTDLLLSSLLALVYTNDIFTAYVFVEINTIAACGLIMITQSGRTLEAAMRYMIMSLLGSGLFLIGICILYDITGHLLMSNILETVAKVASDSTYRQPLIIAVALMSVGLAIKSALYPFHAWLPDAYGYSTVSSAAMLSSLVSKGYIFLLIKIIYRVIGFEVFRSTGILNILFVFGLLGMIMGSWSAIQENDIRRMIAFSSIAQIGYIYMGIGLGTKAGMVAAIFHIFSHAATKAMLFVSAMGLTDVSGGSKKFQDLTGCGYRNVLSGIAFTVGGLSMVGIPLFSGFISKLLFAEAAVLNNGKMLPTLIVLAISTILNAVYFMKTVIRIYTPVKTEYPSIIEWKNPSYALSLSLFMILNVILGLCSDPIVSLIDRGLNMFS